MEKSLREQTLKYIIKNTLWMARRYADGRRSYATSMYNEAARMALSLGIINENDNPDGTWWAEDSDGLEFSGLNEEEYKQLLAAKGGNKCN